MESLGLLCGHLLGDYIIQNDWMASNKTNEYPWCHRHTRSECDTESDYLALKPTGKNSIGNIKLVILPAR